MEMVLSLNPEWIFMCINRDFCETFRRGKYIVHRKPVRDCVKSLLSADGDHMDDKVVITICREQHDATVGPDFRVHFMNPAWHPVTYDKQMASLVGSKHAQPLMTKIMNVIKFDGGWASDGSGGLVFSQACFTQDVMSKNGAKILRGQVFRSIVFDEKTWAFTAHDSNEDTYCKYYQTHDVVLRL